MIGQGEGQGFSEADGYLRFAVMCNSFSFQRWQADAILDLQKKGHQIVLLIQDSRHSSVAEERKTARRCSLSRHLFNFLMRKLFDPDAKRMVDLSETLQQVDTIRCRVTEKGFSEYFTDADIDVIKTHHPDFILRFGFNIIRGEVLNAAKYGVWSFHHDDEMKYRGGPAGFWEIYRGDQVTGAIMQRLTEKLDAGIILEKGYLKTTQHSYKGNLEQLLTVSSSWPGKIANELVARQFRFDSPNKTTAQIFKLPNAFQLILFLLIILRNRLGFYYRELFRAEIWNVGLIKKPIGEVVFGKDTLRPDEVSWLRLLSDTKYLADPMGFMEGSKLHILVEDYSYRTQRATISEIIWNSTRDSFSAPIPIIEVKDHLSYPFIVNHENIIYCIPEAYRSGMIVLYKRNFSEESFIEEKMLLSGIDAIDPTLIYHENMWFLFFTEKRYSWTHLQVYYASEIMGPYLPHKQNPVKIDIRSSRPGGTPFYHEGELYRPAQDCSEAYGRRIIINRIDKLTKEEFGETPVKVLEPLRESFFNKGFHTISSVGRYTLIDGKRYGFNYHFLINQIKTKISNLKKSDG